MIIRLTLWNFNFTQTNAKNLSLYMKGTVSHPWFLGPIFVFRTVRNVDFEFFWQPVKRYKKELELWRAIWRNFASSLKYNIPIMNQACYEKRRGLVKRQQSTVKCISLIHKRRSLKSRLSVVSIRFRIWWNSAKHDGKMGQYQERIY